MATPGKYVDPDHKPELTNQSFGPFVLHDDLAQYIPAAAIGGVALTLHVDKLDDAAEPVINALDHTPILATSRLLLLDNGSQTTLTLRLGHADMPILNPVLTQERHVATLLFTYNGPAGKATFEIYFTVRNAPKAP